MAAPTTSTEVLRASGFEVRTLVLRVVGGPDRGLARPLGRVPVVIGAQPGCELQLGGRGVSRRHAEVRVRDGQVHLRDLGSTNGTLVGGARVERATLLPGIVIGIGESQLVVESLDARAEIEPSPAERLGTLVGRSLGMRRIFAVLERAAPTAASILIEGETGTGKEEVARTVWQLSDRRDQPLVVVDCSALGASLVESELFGHVKGAFTGAAFAREGVFRRADGGTVFIDEITALPLALQPRLLRALEAREVRPVGSDRPVPIDVRILAAADRHLPDEVEAGRFRADLFYRLSVVHLRLPPLRERPDDLPLLVRRFVRLAGGDPLAIGEPLLARLGGHPWPGNVRELRNAVERAFALGGEAPLEALAAALDPGLATAAVAEPVELDLPYQEAKRRALERFDRAYLRHAVEAARGNVSEAARRTGTERKYLSRLLAKYGLGPGDHDD